MRWQIISGWMEHVDMPLDFYRMHISRENGIFITFLHKLYKHKSYNPRPSLEQYEGL